MSASGSVRGVPLWPNVDQASHVLGAIQCDHGVGPQNLVFVSLIYMVSPTDVLQMTHLLWSAMPESERATACWPFVPSTAQRELLFPNDPGTRPWHPVAEAIMTEALKWCRTHHQVEVPEDVFRAIVEQAEAA